MGVYIPNMEKPKDCSECILADKHLNGLYEAKYYCRLEADSCPLIEIDDTVWENEKYKLIRMTQEARINKAMAERRTDDYTIKANK